MKTLNTIKSAVDTATIDYIAKCWSKNNKIRKTFQVLYFILTIGMILCGITGGILLLKSDFFGIQSNEQVSHGLIFGVFAIQLILSALIKPFIKKADQLKTK